MPWLLAVPAALALWLLFIVWLGVGIARVERERAAADRRLICELAKHPTNTETGQPT